MILKNISIKNFMLYGNQEQILDLSGTGITSISGLNGTGKSSCIIDSLLFALYGKYRTPTIDEIVNHYTGKNCKVSVEFEEDGELYKIIRYRKHEINNNNVYIFKGDQDISGHTSSETNDIILDIIKINYIGFINSTVFSSELYSGFLANKESDRLIVFENILNLKEISLFYVEAKKILKELNEERENVVIEQNGINSAISTINSSIISYNNSAKEKLLQMKLRKDSLTKEIEECNNLIKEYSIIDVVKEKEKLDNFNIKLALEEKLKGIEIQLKNLSIDEPVESLRIIDKYKDVDFYSNKMKELKYKESLEILNSRKSGYELKQSFIQKLNSQIDSLEKEKKSYFEENRDLEDKINSLKSNICPFCKQHMTNAEENIKNINFKIEANISSMKEIDKELENINIELNQAREEYNYLVSDYNNIKEKLDNNFISNSDLIEEQYKNALARVKEVEKLKLKNSELYENLNNEKILISEQLKNIILTKYTEEELDDLSNKIEKQKNLINEKEKEIILIDGSVKSVYDKSYIDNLKNDIENKSIELNNITTKLNEIDYNIKHYEFLTNCFSNKSSGFKKYFVGNMIDIFNEKINQYLPFFFSEKVEIKIDKNLSDTITVDGFKRSFTSFSQGQRTRAELAINFALFDVARIFFSNDNKLLVLDEMDAGLDQFGIKAMINLLKGMDKDLKIFIVSHNPNTAEECEDVVSIQRDKNGFSVIKQ